ncbi:type IV pili methyl-accepting chemotaxis transducer N-terminal domain-containing protein [Uliginosibacterium sp. sgz301328]|uniref:type IV pili methyl-accepting chemotaxis transducer N-terminal domain-containing protein n=1 Tax=Uliginosibacterium sp. sgz301328 TaxID=3243764 RepID=UPI00359EE042
MDDTSTDLSRLPMRQQLSFRVLALLMAALAVGLLTIGVTLYLSWQLEGGGAAINAAGSLRMRTYKMALTLSHYARNHDPALAERIERERADFAETLALLRHGDPTRPLYLPNDARVRQQFTHIETEYARLDTAWIQPLLGGTRLENWYGFRRDFDEFVDHINELVLSIEQLNTERTMWLRLSQMVLIALAIAGTVTQIYLMFLLIFRPLGHLRQAIGRMAEKDFTVRLPVQTRDEFGEVQEGFNRMADRLADAYGSLERRVEEKTSALNAQNRELAVLYDVATFLNGAHTPNGLCHGTLERLVQWTGADGGSVRVIDPLQQSAWLITSIGLPEGLRESPVCAMPRDCLCGPAQDGRAVIRVLACDAAMESATPCSRAGFGQVSAFPVSAGESQVGILALHFIEPRELGERQQQLITTLGQHLGIALENQRLAARDRELAVSEERNLMAQGLHDSIAQGLTFLNLQVQLLDDSLRRNALDEAREVVPLLRAGVNESYEDVRELLLNFRTRLQEGDLAGAMRAAIDKLRQQTGITTSLALTGHGAVLPTDMQLQLLFILQEALSNVRKHSGATRVDVTLHNGLPLRLEIRDNGRGFDEAIMAERAGTHVGLSIMRERAERLGASLEFIDDGGVTVVVTMNRAGNDKVIDGDTHGRDDTRLAG